VAVPTLNFWPRGWHIHGIALLLLCTQRRSLCEWGRKLWLYTPVKQLHWL